MDTKIDVILIYSGIDKYFLQTERKAETGLKKTPKLGLLYLAAVLKNKNLTCKILDQTIENFSPQRLLKLIQINNPLFVGFYSANRLKNTCINYINFIRENNSKVTIIVGGPDYFSKLDYLTTGADFVCNGEGEATISELTDYLLHKELSLNSIQGISFISDGKVITTQAREKIEDLDKIPFPDWDIININNYSDLRIINMRKPFVTMITSRGCFGKCSFCSSPRIWGSLRIRSAENVLSEIDYLVKKYKVRYIGFRDDVFAANPSWTQEFCAGMINRRYNLIWSCQTHPFVLKENMYEKLRLLKKAGCDLIILGLQKTEPQILKEIGRSPYEPEVIRKIVSAARKFGIFTVIEFIFGLPQETSQTIKKDIDFSINIKPNYVHFYHLITLEGTRIYDDYIMKNKKLCDLTDEQIQNYILKAMLKFYLHPLIILQAFMHILLKPKFFFIGIIYLTRLIKSKCSKDISGVNKLCCF